MFLEGVFFSSPAISSPRAVNFGPGCSNRRIKTIKKIRGSGRAAGRAMPIGTPARVGVNIYWRITKWLNGPTNCKSLSMKLQQALPSLNAIGKVKL